MRLDFFVSFVHLVVVAKPVLIVPLFNAISNLLYSKNPKGYFCEYFAFLSNNFVKNRITSISKIKLKMC